MARFLSRRMTLIAAAVLLAAGPAMGAMTDPKTLPEDMSQGNAKAKVTVIEYASASCPHCARFNNNVFPAFKKKYIDTGKVHYVFREFLTQPVEIAAAGFLLARCSGQAKYFATLDDFFHQQAKLYETGDAKTVINAVGGKAGLTEAEVQTCLGDEAAAKALNERVERYADKEKVEYTPTFVINGKPLPEQTHEVVLADLDAVIVPLLKGKGR